MTDKNSNENPLEEKYYYSVSNKGFYLLSDMPLYAVKPSDLVEMSKHDYLSWCEPPSGFYQIFDENGPRLEELSPTDYQAMAASALTAYLDEATQAITVWQTKLLMGRKLTDAETTSLNAWMDYIDVLNDTDISDAPDVQWPTKPSV